MNVKNLTRAAVIAALYVVVTLVLAPISFGAVQLRVSEALTLLVVLCPEAVAGVSVGCFIANMVASNPIDMVVGTAATLLAALASRRLRGVRWRGLAIPSALPPVFFNAVIIGAQITTLYGPEQCMPSVYLLNMAAVGAGQVFSCALGVFIVWFIEQNPPLLRLFQQR